MRRIATPAPPTGLRRLAFRLPVLLFRAGLGGLFGGRLMLLTHIGRVSGKPRQVVIEAIEHDPATGAHIGPSGYGIRSDWYRNVVRTPEVVVRLGARPRPMTAEPLSPEEGVRLMARYGSRHPRLAGRLARFMGFEVDGGPADFEEVGRRIAFVRFVPRRPSEGRSR
ncbi:nitroreductase family deazaflavin-dependent oxidoreductase [Spongiactinospora rosea]|uniref:Nitroreductase family deazaflavin-dependent oxidoreductase n=1 Tax=Spongiactinospora rosea TaxID=2248750 RepID=A0A366LQ68_9ACTN|nr:nitroreductase family deazaflavin-dependent oxidoreductase [Spongiactinospora rosea]RBQ16085.1 nitroreductase family deazaflavin-dependent oxidoreductase [Spongiactinospora rosea]